MSQQTTRCPKCHQTFTPEARQGLTPCPCGYCPHVVRKKIPNSRIYECQACGHRREGLPIKTHAVTPRQPIPGTAFG